MFNGQPIALVVAETSEIAGFAASLVRVEYEKDAHITDVYRRREAAIPVKPPADPTEALFTPPKTRGRPEEALASAAVRHAGEYYVPIEHHNPMELYAATVIYEANGKLTVYDKTQGVQNVQRPALQMRQCKIRAQARTARSCDRMRHARAKCPNRDVCARIRDARACG